MHARRWTPWHATPKERFAAVTQSAMTDTAAAARKTSQRDSGTGLLPFSQAKKKPRQW